MLDQTHVIPNIIQTLKIKIYIETKAYTKMQGSNIEDMEGWISYIIMWEE